MKKVISVYGNFANEKDFEREVAKMYKQENQQQLEENRNNITAKKVYFYKFNIIENESCNVAITTDINHAERMDKSYKLASIDEVNSCIEDLCINGEYVKVIEVEEGIYGYMEQEFITNLGDEELFCNYVWMHPSSQFEIDDLVRCFGR